MESGQRQVKMVICPNCQAGNPPQGKYCMWCGKALSVPSTNQQISTPAAVSRNPRRPSRVLPYTGIATVILGIALFLWYALLAIGYKKYVSDPFSDPYLRQIELGFVILMLVGFFMVALGVIMY